MYLSLPNQYLKVNKYTIGTQFNYKRKYISKQL